MWFFRSLSKTPDKVAGDSPARWESASQWELMRQRFVKHRLAVWSLRIVIAAYFIAFFCDFLVPYSLEDRNVELAYAPPQQMRLISEEGVHFWPFVYQLEVQRHPETLRRVYREDRSRRVSIRLFPQSERYYLGGLIPLERRLFGVEDGMSIHLLGTDSLGRDLFSRILYGTRISLTIGLVGVALSVILGLIIGTISGYFGGVTDNLIQRMIEALRSFPTIPLWMALSAALPRTWGPLQIYFGITVVLSLIGWTGLARQVRGKILALREEDYAMAARFAGASDRRIMFRHLLPGFMSHIVVSISLSVPAMILGETALSFLGLGLRPPVTSWGVLLMEAQNVQAVAMQPWLLTPVVFLVVIVLAFNFVGDGLRDAADPYSR